MQKFILKLRRVFARYVLLSYIVIWLIDFWASRQLDKALDEGVDVPTMLDVIGSLLSPLTNPYAVGFFIGGAVFSFPEWWPYLRKYTEALSEKVSSIFNSFSSKPHLQSDRHNVSLLEAIHYIATGKWDNVRQVMNGADVHVTDEDIDNISRAWRESQQAAINGEIRLWGLDARNHWIEILDQTYWQRHWISWMNILAGDDENDFELNELLGVDNNDTARKDQLYHSYMTSKKDIEKLWQ